MHVEDDDFRTVVGRLGGRRASELSVTAAASTLLAVADWATRLTLLAADPRLVDGAVAVWCTQQGDDLLGALITRSEDVGVEAAGHELSLVLELRQISAVDPSEQTVEDLIRLVDQIRASSVWWAESWLFGALEHVTSHPDCRQKRLRDAVERLLTERVGCDAASVRLARELATAQRWQSVWEQLPALPNVDALRAACGVAAQMAPWFSPDTHFARSLDDLVSLLETLQERGPEAAVREHKLVLTARRLPTYPGVEAVQRARDCSRIAADSWTYFQSTGALWVLRGGLVAAEAAYNLTPEDGPERASYASTFGGLVSVAVQAGALDSSAIIGAVDRLREACTLAEGDDRLTCVFNLGTALAEAVNADALEPTSLAEAVGLLREAYKLTSEDHPQRAMCAANLGNRISQAVTAGVLDPGTLREALKLQREAIARAPQGHPNRPLHAHDLGTLLSQAVQAGVLRPTYLVEAEQREREAYTRLPQGSPYRAMFGSSLGVILSEGVQAGILDPSVLTEAVELQREAYRLVPKGHSDRAVYASHLGNRLAEAVQAGKLDQSVLIDAVELNREAYTLTPPSHAHRAVYASSLGIRLADAVRAGVAESSALKEAVALLLDAYTNTAEDHPNRALYASNLAQMAADAVGAGIADAEVLSEAVNLAREAYRRTPGGHPDRAEYASKLGNHLAEAATCGILDKAALTEAVALLREACSLTPEGHPDRASNAAGLGIRLYEAVRAGVLDQAALNEAVALLREAYSLTPEGHPNRALHASNLGSRLTEAVRVGVVPSAEAVGEIAGLVDDVWRLARAGVTPIHRRRIITTTRDFATTAPLLLAEIAGPGEAARAVEALRGHLSAGMHAPLLPDGLLPQELATDYRAAATRYENAQQRAVEGISDYSTVAPAVAALAHLVEEIRRSSPALAGFGGRPQLTDLSSNLALSSAGIYVIPGPADSPGVAIVLRSDTPPRCIALPGLTGHAVIARVSSFLSRRPDLPGLCEWIWDTIVEPLLPELGDATDWVVIPTGYVGLLPLHAAGSDLPRQPSNGTRTPRGWLDDVAAIRVVPSLLVLDRAIGAPLATGAPLVAISDAIDLEFLKADRVIAQHIIPGARPLDGEVSPDSVLRALVETPTAVISGHAAHSLTEGGGLALGEDPPGPDGSTVPRWLTAVDVERLPLRVRDLVVLSSCSSGQISTDLPDETIGLPAALLRVGFASVIATAWPVSDRVAFVTLTRLLQQRATHPDQPPATTLRNTRRWLRTATRDELLTWLDTLEESTPGLPPEPIKRLRKWWTNTPDPHPMSDPRDWAPYGCTGR